MKLQALVMDFDGVMSDDKVYTDGKGNEMVCTSKSDGYGLRLLKADYPELRLLVLSHESNTSVSARCHKLGLPFIGCHGKDKFDVLTIWLEAAKISMMSTAYIGNDLNDLPIIRSSVISLCPSDAQPEIKNECHFILHHPGGNGAIRQACRWISEGRLDKYCG